ncbi:TIGR03808 family TAT-translocated repetitive protein [Phyllobacterium endophyticum]|uniref:TIGR03808 family TAT-translocated repetitive protein n=1 Tax=Phyllobacterium endophyticum TaxID=1149773 RepID=UPI0011CB875F|nr:TIGR03808 family TAT-translocated repetitive protein [Phyllobacterium endophyticum]TXR49794.1 TIGR03808 family TAT-translocated repetitive protein [Phyllobacterium endophyticum]
MIDRRIFLTGLAALAGTGILPQRTEAQASSGMINAAEFGLKPGAPDDQTVELNALLVKASSSGQQIFLPPGTYIVSGVQAPGYVNLSGVPGKSRLLFGGRSALMTASGSTYIQLSGLVIDGDGRPLGESVRGLLEASNVPRLVLDDCQIVGGRRNAVDLFKCGGRIEHSRISGASDAAIFAADSTGLSISGNEINDCGNGGIIVQRYDQGRDGTIISGNRIGGIRADAGGTGQNGNAINVFRANNVVVSNNIISDSAFSAIRGNSASNLQVSGNNCTASGETAIYSEFAFEGAIIANNLVDGAANGISMVNFDNGGRLGTCNGNLVRNLASKGPYPGTFGIGISAEADISIAGNVVENAPLYGIQLGWGAYMRNVIAIGNIVRTSGEGIYVSVVPGAGSAIICDNIIQGSRNGGIVGHSWSDITARDLTAKGAHIYPNLIVERNIVS